MNFPIPLWFETKRISSFLIEIKCAYFIMFHCLYFRPCKDLAREILSSAAGVVVIDDRAANLFPTPLQVSNKDDVAVGRIRQDVSQDGNYGYIHPYF